jgi:hypothetical protein
MAIELKRHCIAAAFQRQVEQIAKIHLRQLTIHMRYSVFQMQKALFFAVLSIVLTACGGNTDVKYKVLIGATTIPSLGAPPIEDSVIVIAGTKIRNVGIRSAVPIPQNSDRTDLAGRWIVPDGPSPIAPEEPANLIVLDHAPAGIQPGNPDDVGARIGAGEWIPAKDLTKKKQ